MERRAPQSLGQRALVTQQLAGNRPLTLEFGDVKERTPKLVSRRAPRRDLGFVGEGDAEVARGHDDAIEKIE